LLLNPIVIKYIGDFNCLLRKKKLEGQLPVV